MNYSIYDFGYLRRGQVMTEVGCKKKGEEEKEIKVCKISKYRR